VVTALGAVATKKDLNMSHSKTPTRIKSVRAERGAKRPTKPQDKHVGSSRSGTKQEAVLAQRGEQLNYNRAEPMPELAR
jgi:hypothetical protein